MDPPCAFVHFLCFWEPSDNFGGILLFGASVELARMAHFFLCVLEPNDNSGGFLFGGATSEYQMISHELLHFGFYFFF